MIAIVEGETETAQKRLQEALVIRPNSYEAHLEQGKLLLDSGNTAEAAQSFGRALRSAPQEADAYFLAALALSQEGRLNEARHLSQQAIERQPDWTEAAGLAAELALTRSSFSQAAKSEALALAQNAARLSQRQDPKILATLTRAYLLNGLSDEARLAARQAKENAARLKMSSLEDRITTQFADLLEAVE